MDQPFKPSDATALIARNPASGEIIEAIPATEPGDVSSLVERARKSQALWGETKWPERREFLKRWWRILTRDTEAWTDALIREIGKPRPEALAEVISTLDHMRWTVHHAGRCLRDEPLPRGHQRWFLIPPAKLCWRPYGVIGILGTWNYPLFLNAPAIAHALAAGNAVVWKPSELAPHTGRLLQQSIDQAQPPPGLVAAVMGAAEVGRALVSAPIDKGQYTGGIEVGRSILKELAGRGIPAIAELSGFDPAIILPDAPRSETAKALAWSAFVNAGQTCVAVKRVYVVGDARAWAEELANLAAKLRICDPSRANADLGPMISERARSRFHDNLTTAVKAGAELLTGGQPVDGPGWFYRPTVLLAREGDDSPERILQGCFGPILLVRGVAGEQEALAAANAGPYGLAASVWGRDTRRAQSLAQKLNAGMVAVNDAVAPLAHAAAPFGGVKASGFGRVHGALGLREFAQPQVVHRRSSRTFRPQVYPYGPTSLRALHIYKRAFHGPG